MYDIPSAIKFTKIYKFILQLYIYNIYKAMHNAFVSMVLHVLCLRFAVFILNTYINNVQAYKV